MQSHPMVGIEWVISLGLMMIVIWLRMKGWSPSSMWGMGLGGCVTIISHLISPTQPITFEPESFMYMLLPPIVLHSGLMFDIRSSKRTLSLSLCYAWVGTLTTALWVGYALWSVDAVESLALSFWIGSVVASTDAVSTIELTKTKNIDDNVKTILNNESIFNDAVAVMLVHTCSRWYENSISMESREMIEIVAVTIGLCVLSICIGVLLAFISKYWSNNSCAVLILSLLSYAICESIGSSGIISIFFFGITFKTMNRETIVNKFSNITRVMSEFSELYVYVSMGAVVMGMKADYMKYGWTVFCACIVSRVFYVFVIGYFFKLGGETLSIRDLNVIISGGIRGAVSMALAVSSPKDLYSLFLTITAMEVMLSMIFTMLMLRCLVKKDNLPI